MTSPLAKSVAGQFSPCLPAGVFLAFSFGFIWLWINPALPYHHLMPAFYTGKPFLAQFASTPGGWVAYGARFLAQIQQYAWLGALLYTVILAGVGWGSRWLFNRVHDGGGEFLAYVPAGLLLVLAGRYDYSWLETGVGLLLSLGAAVACLAVSQNHRWLHLPVLLLLAVFLNYGAGPIPAALFAILASAPVLAAAQGRVWGVGGLVIGLSLSWLFTRWFALEPSRLWLAWGQGLPRYLTLMLFLFYPAGMVVLLLLPRRAAASAPAEPANGKTARKDKSSRQDKWQAFWTRRFAAPVLYGSLMLAIAGAAFASVDYLRKGILKVNYLASQEKWDAALDAAARLKEVNASVRMNINHALYHKGLLLDHLFTYLQSEAFGMLPGLDHGLEVCYPLSTTLLELGQVNLAEHWACEALEEDGERPDTLKVLAKINVVKGKPQAARTFLGRLRKNPFYQRWAGEYLERLDADPKLADDSEIAQYRSVMVTTDYPGSFHQTASMLQQLLQTNPKNRMAFEYLMAGCLLARKPESILKNLIRLDDFAMPNLPRHIEEALLLYQRTAQIQKKTAPVMNLHGRVIRPETVRRFESFRKIATQYVDNLPAAQAALAPHFADTYWYYCLFDTSGRWPRPTLRELKP